MHSTTQSCASPSRATVATRVRSSTSSCGTSRRVASRSKSSLRTLSAEQERLRLSDGSSGALELIPPARVLRREIFCFAARRRRFFGML
jgi:hypothetical protein